MIFPLQAIGFVFALAMLFFTFYSFKRREFNNTDTAIWGTVWLAFLAALGFSDFFDSLLAPLKVASLFDLLMAFGVGVSLFAAFWMYRKVRKTEERVRQIVRKVALEKD